MLGDRGRATAGNEEEDLAEKKADLEIQYKKLQLALHDILDRNEELVVQNKGKDTILTIKERELEDLTTRNQLEVEQLLLEQTCLVEELNHQLEAVSGRVIRCELQKERYLILQQENDEINRAIDQLRNEISEQNESHAKEMHRMNVFMKTERIRMENLFRNELVAMDMAFQNKAFLELDDNRKQAMFANTKLKDELGLLSVGLSALGVRYEKDTRSARDARLNLDDLEKSGRALQTAVKSLMTLKVGKRDTINQIKTDIKLFKEKKGQIDSVLSVKPSIPELEKTLFQTDVLLGREERAIAMWKERKRLINLLKKEFKTATFEGGELLLDSTSLTSGKHSRNGSLSGSASLPSVTKTWAPESSMINSGGSLARSGVGVDNAVSDRSADPEVSGHLRDGSLISIGTMNSSKRGPAKTDFSINRTASGINLRSLSVNDKELKKGLRRLIGKESMLLDAYNENPETNVTAWATAQIVDIFATTYEQWKVSNGVVEAQLATIAEAAEAEERKLREAEDVEMTNDVSTIAVSNTIKSVPSVTQESLERNISSHNIGDVFEMVQSSSSSSSESDEPEFLEVDDEDDFFVGESIDEIINDMEQPVGETTVPKLIEGQISQDYAEEEEGDEPAPLLLDVTTNRSKCETASESISSIGVRFMSDQEVISPGAKSAVSTAGRSNDYFTQHQNQTKNYSPSFGRYVNRGDDSEYDKNGLSKSYSANAVIHQALLEKSNDAERRSSYEGFYKDSNLEELLLASQNKINNTDGVNVKRHFELDFQPIKLGKRKDYLDGVEPPLATRSHLMGSADISKFVDPRVNLKGFNNILHQSKTDSNLLTSQKSSPIGRYTSMNVSSQQNLSYARSGALGRESNRFPSSGSMERKNILGLVDSLKQKPVDPLSGKATRALQKKY